MPSSSRMADARVSPKMGDPDRTCAPYCRYQAMVLAIPSAPNEKAPRRKAPAALALVNASVIVSKRPKSAGIVCPFLAAPARHARGITATHILADLAVGFLHEELQLAVIQFALVIGGLACRLHRLHIGQRRGLLVQGLYSLLGPSKPGNGLHQRVEMP